MKCPNCAAETQGKFCEYCGCEISQENNEGDSNIGKCPKCGNCKITFKRECIGSLTKSRSRKNNVGTGRQGQSVSQSEYRTIGICQNCGYTWNPNEVPQTPKKKTWLWVLGWICIFPLPLTILLLRKKEMKPVVKYGIIAVAWLLFSVMCMTSNSETDTSQPDNPSYNETVQNDQGTDNSSVNTNTNDETTVSPSTEKEDVEKLAFELVAGEQGKYGKLITYNEGTEFEESFYAFYIPVGTYTVTNVGEYMSQLNVYSDEIVKNDAGWDEVAEAFFNKVIDVNNSEIITVKEGQHIEIAEPSHFKFEQQ